MITKYAGKEKPSHRAVRGEILGSDQAVDSGFRVGLRFGSHFRAVSDTFSEHKVHVGNADEAEEQRHVRRHQVGWGIFVNTAAAGQDDSAFTFYQTFRPFSV